MAGVALASSLRPGVYAAENNTINVALVGCGGRGTGAAANALSTKGPTKLVAMADVFPDRLNASLKNITKQFEKQVDVPAERQFVGFDAYQKAIDVIGEGDLVILATPPGFRPLHLEYAVAKGRNVFMEKSFAVDGPGIRRVIKAGQEAEKKNLKIAGGLMSRHSQSIGAAIQEIHNGAIGDVIAVWSYRMHGPVGFSARRPGESEIAHQIRNYSNFTWVNGSFLLDWLIHNLDVGCWAKNGWPVSAQGQGGRQVRDARDQLFDHYAVEYTFGDGTRMSAQARHQANTWPFWGVVVHGAKGCAVLGEGIVKPKLYKGHKATTENQIWEFEGKEISSYQYEHDLLFDAIRTNKSYNEAERCAKSAMVGILGRMAAESGKEITWDQAMASNLSLAPNLDTMTMDSPAPVQADAQGNYPIAKPGLTEVL